MTLLRQPVRLGTMRISRISFPVFAALGLVTAAATVCTPPLAHAQTAASPAPSAPTAGPPGMPGAPPRDTSARGPAPAVGTGVVRGRIVAGDTGLPLRRARVMLNSLGRGEPRVTLSDADGAFAFDALPAGRYQLHGSKARYVDGTLGARRPGSQGRPFELADGQTLDSVVLTLAAAGVITGRVLDDFGDIVPGVTVMPMRYRTINGERQLVGMGGRPATSDDTGTFRLYGLAPGTYYVSARADEMGRMGPAVTDASVTGFAPTFYPGTPVAAEAQPIEVVAGAEIVADISLVAARLTSVSGVVVDPAGTRATGGFVMTMQGSRRGMGFGGGGGGGPIKPDGTFMVSGLAPGEYVLQARPSFSANPMFEDATANRLERLATASVTVSGEPIVGLRLAVVDPIRVPVNLIFEHGSASRPERVSVFAGSQSGMRGGNAAIRDDGRLSLEVVPGTYRLSASAATPWLVKRILYRGQEAEAEEVDLTAAPGGRIDVVLTTSSASVAGGVTDAAGKAAAEYTVVIVPADAELARRADYRRMRTARPDQQGRFRAERLPPGDYLAAAVVDLDMQDGLEPEFLDGLRRSAKPFRLREGDTATLSLTLAPVP
jgi:Carboxypeptidase regulatory-like domain